MIRHRLVNHHHHHHHIDDHPAAIFWLMIGTLGFLTAALVFSIYTRADDAGRRTFSAPIHSSTSQR